MPVHGNRNPSIPLRANTAGGGPVGGVRDNADSPQPFSGAWRVVAAQTIALGPRSRAAPALCALDLGANLGTDIPRLAVLKAISKAYSNRLAEGVAS
jgi:hypothetical protein